MINRLRALCAATGIAFAALLASAPASAAWPDRPIRIIVPFSAGSGNDTVGRVVAEELRKAFEVQVVVENRPGAAGVIGIEAALKSPADGYTLVMTSSATHSANPGLVLNLPYDPVRDFAHVTNIITTPLMLVVPQGTAGTLGEFVTKSQAGKAAFGYGSSTSQVAASTFNTIAKITALPVSYKSQPPALTDLASGQIQFMFVDAAASAPFIKGGRVSALAITSPVRSPLYPDVPTLAELGFKEYDLAVWVGVAAPAGTPKEIIDRLSDVLTRGMVRPEIRERFGAVGMEVAVNSVDKQRDFVQQQLQVWKKRIGEAGLKPE